MNKKTDKMHKNMQNYGGYTDMYDEYTQKIYCINV